MFATSLTLTMPADKIDACRQFFAVNAASADTSIIEPPKMARVTFLWPNGEQIMDKLHDACDRFKKDFPDCTAEVGREDCEE